MLGILLNHDHPVADPLTELRAAGVHMRRWDLRSRVDGERQGPITVGIVAEPSTATTAPGEKLTLGTIINPCRWFAVTLTNQTPAGAMTSIHASSRPLSSNTKSHVPSPYESFASTG